MAKSLVIVESPAKARTIGKFLGSEYVVRASIGHVRDLPTSTAEIPEALRKEPWARMGVDVDHDFEPIYVVPAEKKKQIAELKSLLKGSPVLWLATDEDREGESISWHLVEVLKPKVPIKRLVFHEITKEAILAALESPREIDQALVKAQETRRILDRLFGYELSPVLWRKVRRGLSAGRVQSVALRLLVEREEERLRFKKAAYWDLLGHFAATGGAAGAGAFDAVLVELGGKRVATGKDFEPTTGKATGEARVLLEPEARALAERLARGPGKVVEVETKPYTQRPSPPFTTSTLQQEAGRKLRYPAQRTMRVAQGLYENGAITYMRTDSTTLSNQAITAARRWIGSQYGPEYMLPGPRQYESKVKNAQEAHEAIRPAGADFRPIDDVRRELGDDAGALYELIWKRTIASQMPDAKGERVTARVAVGDGVFRASGRTLTFPGFQRAYVEGSDDAEAALEEQDRVLPPLAEGQTLAVQGMEPLGHETQPPARFTEASLIKELDTRGIGRPSTWASIIAVLLERDYAFRRGPMLVPSWTAFVVVRMLKENFGDVLDYEFTARMEEGLDAISRGEDDSREYLRRFYEGNGRPGLRTLVAQGLDRVDPRKACSRPLGQVDGKTIEVRVGKFGLFLSDGERRASLPEDTVPDELTLEKAVALLEVSARAPTPLGQDPATGLPVYVKSGRFGPYVQRGDQVEGGDKPKMVSLLPGMEPATVDLAAALRLLTLPRDLGEHPEDPAKGHVQALLGRYGPYVKWGTESRSIPAGTSVLDIDLAQAVEVLKMPRSRRGRAAPAAPLKELGPHPTGGTPVRVLSGKYGPYVTDGTLNASLPRDADPQTLTMAEALDLLAQRAERVGSGGARRGGRFGKKPGGKGGRKPKSGGGDDATPPTTAPRAPRAPRGPKKGAPPASTKDDATAPADGPKRVTKRTPRPRE